MNAPKEVQDERHEDFWSGDVPLNRWHVEVEEPAELAEQAAAMDAQRHRDNQVCEVCGEPWRGHGVRYYAVGDEPHEFKGAGDDAL